MRKIKNIFYVSVLILTIALPQSLSAENIYDEHLDDHPIESQPLPLEAELALVMDTATGHILYIRGDMHQRAFPASITKIMTALLLLESGADMYDRIFHSPEAVYSIPRHSSHIAMNAGETLTVSQALYAIMLPSANDVSNAIAEFVGGDLETFASMMTQRAKELGATNTNFTNAHGLPDDSHYTTLYDMALIMAELLNHDKFLQVINTPRFIIPPRELQTQALAIDNTNMMVRPTSHHFNLDIVGGKTGWTTPSGHTMVSYANRDDMHLIAVVMGAGRREVIFNDTQTLINFAFEQFEIYEAFDATSFDTHVDLVQRDASGSITIGSIPLKIVEDITLNLPKDISPNALTKDMIIPSRIVAPVEAGVVVGRVSISYNGRVLSEREVITAQGGDVLPPEELHTMREEAPQAQHLSNSIGSLLGGYNYENLFLPRWVLDATPLTIGLISVLLIALILMAVKFLSFSRARKKGLSFRGYSTKRSKAYISKSYKYR
ncbi:MAG: D-alanyl-D-alanine carboxypeptidase [Defluviitaleaceae bacterium]|nr:D-alanyl-D-alanine carboxypeptidase [Defluviitaleaceae bacterium]